MRISLLLLILWPCTLAHAQEPAKKENWLPENGIAPSVDFNEVTIAKWDKTGSKILSARPEFKTVVETGVVD